MGWLTAEKGRVLDDMQEKEGRRKENWVANQT